MNFKCAKISSLWKQASDLITPPVRKGLLILGMVTALALAGGCAGARHAAVSTPIEQINLSNRQIETSVLYQKVYSDAMGKEILTKMKEAGKKIAIVKRGEFKSKELQRMAGGFYSAHDKTIYLPKGEVSSAKIAHESLHAIQDTDLMNKLADQGYKTKAYQVAFAYEAAATSVEFLSLYHALADDSEARLAITDVRYRPYIQAVTDRLEKDPSFEKELGSREQPATAAGLDFLCDVYFQMDPYTGSNPSAAHANYYGNAFYGQKDKPGVDPFEPISLSDATLKSISFPGLKGDLPLLRARIESIGNLIAEMAKTIPNPSEVLRTIFKEQEKEARRGKVEGLSSTGKSAPKL